MAECSACKKEVGTDWSLGQRLKNQVLFYLCDSCYDEIINPIIEYEQLKSKK
jgi:hypothetical protein